MRTDSRLRTIGWAHTAIHRHKTPARSRAKLRTAHLEADFHGSLGYGKVCAPNIVQLDLLLCNGSKKLLHSVLEAHGVDIQRSVQQVDTVFSQA